MLSCCFACCIHWQGCTSSSNIGYCPVAPCCCVLPMCLHADMLLCVLQRCIVYYWRHTSRTLRRRVTCSMPLTQFLQSRRRLTGLCGGSTGLALPLLLDFRQAVMLACIRSKLGPERRWCCIGRCVSHVVTALSLAAELTLGLMAPSSMHADVALCLHALHSSYVSSLHAQNAANSVL